MASHPPRSAEQLRKAAAAKQAATPQQQELLQRLARLGLLSGGVGAAAGAAKVLHGMTQQPATGLGSGSNVPVALPVHSPTEIVSRVSQSEEDTPPALKMAELADMLPQPTNANPLTGNSLPLTLAAATVPAAAAYKGIRGLYDKFRQSEQQTALEKAKADYEKALASQYKNVVTKTAEVADVADAIDNLFEKVANKFNNYMDMWPLSAVGATPLQVYGGLTSSATGGALGNNATEGFNSLKGLTTAAALATALGTGKYMYNRTKKQDPEAVMQEALSRRSRQRQSVPNVLTPQLMTESQ